MFVMLGERGGILRGGTTVWDKSWFNIALLYLHQWEELRRSYVPFLFKQPLPHHYLSFSCSGLLDTLTKNGSSASNGTYRRRAADSSDHTDREGQEPGGGDSTKPFTKEQVDGVQRWPIEPLSIQQTASLILLRSIRTVTEMLCAHIHTAVAGGTSSARCSAPGRTI